MNTISITRAQLYAGGVIFSEASYQAPVLSKSMTLGRIDKNLLI